MVGTVLAIDDSPEVLAVLAARLRTEGLRILTATDWNTGLELAALHSPDVVLLDVNMPELSGLDVCRRLKDDPRTASARVIFLTARHDVETKIHGFDLGATDYVTKPFHPDELRARVRAAIRLKRSSDDLHHKANVDGLTGLRNRASFDSLMQEAVARSAVSDSELSLVMMDIDHFKAINDKYGHVIGDKVLKEIGRALAESVLAPAWACRYGGEELAIILPNTSGAAAVDFAESVRPLLRHLGVRHRTTEIEVTASFGVSTRTDLLRDTNDMVEALVATADLALYLAKREGRNCVRWYVPSATRSDARSISPPSYRTSRVPSSLVVPQIKVETTGRGSLPPPELMERETRR